MTILATRLPSFDAEQFNLPGLSAFSTSVEWTINPYVAEEPVPGRIVPGPGQLHFGPSQEPLAELPRVAVQLPLVPDPPVWEAEPHPPAPRRRKGRLARKRGNLGLSPGQMSLF
jgi:hypothetical protein